MKITKYLVAATPVMAALAMAPAHAQSDGEEHWEGPYIGGSIGLGAQSNDKGETLVFDTNLDGTYGDQVTTASGANAFSPGFCNGAATGSANIDCRGDKDGLEYYVRAGYDVQEGNIVYGVVFDGGKSESRDSVSGFSTTPASYTLNRELDWSVGARARVGYAARGALFYATGGATYGQIDNSFTTTNGANSFTDNGKSKSWGYTYGGGAEVKITDNFAMGLEYLRSTYTDDDYVVSVGRGTAPATNPFLTANANGTDIKRSNGNFNTHNLRLTASFRF